MARLLYFGRSVEAARVFEETRDLPEHVQDTDALRRWLDADKQAGGALLEASIRLAINSEIVSEPAPVSNTDEIAFMPPVGGG